jgi:hypothetical protein
MPNIVQNSNIERIFLFYRDGYPLKRNTTTAFASDAYNPRDENGYDWHRDKPDRTIPFGKYVLDVENKDAVLNRKLKHRDGNKTINGIIKYFSLLI